MRTAQEWLICMAKAIKPTNKAIHRICVPAIFFALSVCFGLSMFPAQWRSDQ